MKVFKADEKDGYVSHSGARILLHSVCYGPISNVCNVVEYCSGCDGCSCCGLGDISVDSYEEAIKYLQNNDKTNKGDVMKQTIVETTKNAMVVGARKAAVEKVYDKIITKIIKSVPLTARPIVKKIVNKNNPLCAILLGNALILASENVSKVPDCVGLIGKDLMENEIQNGTVKVLEYLDGMLGELLEDIDLSAFNGEESND